MAQNLTFDEITQTVTSAEGMVKKNKAIFHAFNPNGALASLPKTAQFTVGKTFYSGAWSMYNEFDNYHAKKIMSFVKGKRFTRWELTYHVNEIAKDLIKANKFIDSLK